MRNHLRLETALPMIAALVAAGIAPKAIDPRLGGLAGEFGALIIALGICYFLLRGGRQNASTTAA